MRIRLKYIGRQSDRKKKQKDEMNRLEKRNGKSKE